MPPGRNGLERRAAEAGWGEETHFIPLLFFSFSSLDPNPKLYTITLNS